MNIYKNKAGRRQPFERKPPSGEMTDAASIRMRYILMAPSR